MLVDTVICVRVVFTQLTEFLMVWLKLLVCYYWLH